MTGLAAVLLALGIGGRAFAADEASAPEKVILYGREMQNLIETPETAPEDDSDGYRCGVKITDPASGRLLSYVNYAVGRHGRDISSDPPGNGMQLRVIEGPRAGIVNSKVIAEQPSGFFQALKWRAVFKFYRRAGDVAPYGRDDLAIIPTSESDTLLGEVAVDESGSSEATLDRYRVAATCKVIP